MNKLKKVLLGLLVLLMIGSIVGCGNKTGGGSEGGAKAAEYDPSKEPVAVCMMVMNHPVHRIVQLGFLKAAKELGYTNAKVIGTESGDAMEAFATVEPFIAEGGKGLLLWAGDSSAYSTLKLAKNAGVAVGVPHFKHNPVPEGLTFGMACDPAHYGAQVAEFMASKLSGKSGSVAITQNTKNLTEDAASDSFQKTWASLGSKYDLSKIKLLPVQLEGAVVDQATAVNLAIIQANRDLIGAFGTTGNSPITWADAASKAGKKDGELVIVGMDATEGNLDNLEAGKVAALVAQPLYEEAYKTMEYLDTVLRGGTVPQWTDLDAPIVTKDGSGPNGIAYHRNIAGEVKTFFK